MPVKFTIPEFVAGWPFKRAENPFLGSVAPASIAWMRSFSVIDDKMMDFVESCALCHLTSLVYPRVDPLYFRLACDYMLWGFVLDYLGDTQDRETFEKVAAGVMDCLRNPSKPSTPGESGIEAMTKSMWTRCLKIYAVPSSAQRFVDVIGKFFVAASQEIDDRENNRLRSIEDYFELRRGTGAVTGFFHFLLLRTFLPDYVLKHPRIKHIVSSAEDLILLSNDVYSLNFERSMGLDVHNMVPVVMGEKGVDTQKAIDHIAEMHSIAAGEFIEGIKDVPSFSEEIDPVVTEFIFGMGNWVAGINEWSFDTERYFGKRGLEVKVTRVVELVPRKSEE